MSTTDISASNPAEGGCRTAALAGAALAGIPQVAFFPMLTMGSLWREKIVLVLTGNFLIAIFSILMLTIVTRARRRPLPRASFFLAGLLLGLTPMAHPWLTSMPLRLSGALAAIAIGAILGLRLRLPKAAAMALCHSALLLYVVLFVMNWLQPIGRVGGPALSDAPATAGSGPDVILVSIDTLRASELLSEEFSTPNIDALREQSLWADYALAPSGSTRPSHVTMLSGYPIQAHGVWTNTSQIPRDLGLLAEQFQQAGWRTLGVVSNGVLRGVSGIDRGFQTYDDSAVRYGGLAAVLRRRSPQSTWAGWLLPRPALDMLVSDWILGMPQAEGGTSATGERTTQAAKNYLEALYTSEAPFFFFLHYMDPHKPYWPDKSVRGSLIDPKQALPSRYKIGKSAWKLPLEDIEADLRRDANDDVAREAVEVVHAVYREEIVYIDACLGEVLEQVEASGRPTVILLTSDHGEGFAEHQTFEHGNSVYGELLQVPFMLKRPAVRGGRLGLRPRLEDVPKTLLAAAGLKAPDGLPGRNLLTAAPRPNYPPLVAGRPLDLGEKEPLGWQQEGWQFSIRDGDWKLIAHAVRIGNDYPDVTARELYNLAHDAAEQNNLLEREAARVTEMTARLEAVLKVAIEGGREELDAAGKAALDELGYANGDSAPEDE